MKNCFSRRANFDCETDFDAREHLRYTQGVRPMARQGSRPGSFQLTRRGYSLRCFLTGRHSVADNGPDPTIAAVRLLGGPVGADRLARATGLA